MKKSIDQRLFEAYRNGTGVNLSAEDVAELMIDDAIECRIGNMCALEAGSDRQDGSKCDPNMTWSQNRDVFKNW